MLVRSIPEVWEEITEEIKADHPEFVCPISFHVPLIPIKLKGIDRNYELGAFLCWISQSPHDPIDRRKVTVETVAVEYEMNQELIKIVDKKLEERGYTREVFLFYYNVSPELYAYLCRLDFPKKSNQLEKIKEVISRHEIAVALFMFIPAVALFFIYRQLFLSQVCLSSAQLNEHHYNFQYDRIMHRYVNLEMPLNQQGPWTCKSLWPTDFDKFIPRLHYFDGQNIGLSANEIFFETTTGRLKENDSVVNEMALVCAFFSFVYVYSTILRLSESNLHYKKLIGISNTLSLLALIGMGLEAIMNQLKTFDGIQSNVSVDNSIVRACNEAYLHLHLRLFDSTPIELSPVFQLPKCDTPSLNVVTAGCGLLAIPAAFFGASLIRSGWKKLTGHTLEGQVDGLREKNFTYHN